MSNKNLTVIKYVLIFKLILTCARLCIQFLRAFGPRQKRFVSFCFSASINSRVVQILHFHWQFLAKNEMKSIRSVQTLPNCWIQVRKELSIDRMICMHANDLSLLQIFSKSQERKFSCQAPWPTSLLQLLQTRNLFCWFRTLWKITCWWIVVHDGRLPLNRVSIATHKESAIWCVSVCWRAIDSLNECKLCNNKC